MRSFVQLQNDEVVATLQSERPPGANPDRVPAGHREVTGLDPLPGIGWRWDPANKSWDPPVEADADPREVRRRELLARDPASVSTPELVELLQLLFR